MSATRVPFDSKLPFVVAAQELVYGPKSFVRGDAFSWRELGVSEQDLVLLWAWFKIDNVVPAASPSPAQPSSSSPTPAAAQVQSKRSQPRR